jgi:hypothetical protein
MECDQVLANRGTAFHPLAKPIDGIGILAKPRREFLHFVLVPFLPKIVQQGADRLLVTLLCRILDSGPWITSRDE